MSDQLPLDGMTVIEGETLSLTPLIEPKPTNYRLGERKAITPDAANKVIGLISNGLSIIQACRLAKVSRTTLYRWIDESRELRDRFDTARDQSADCHAEALLKIADEAPRMVATKFGEAIDPAGEAWRKTRIQTRQWMASKLSTRYADNVEHKHTGKVAVTIAAIDRDL